MKLLGKYSIRNAAVRTLCGLFAAGILSCSILAYAPLWASAEEPETAVAEVPVYRLYYRPTHEHLFTTDVHERDVLSSERAWVDEGTAWVAPSEGEPVYRLFNPATTEHLYTRDANEYRVLGGNGWEQEGICWYSVPEAQAVSALQKANSTETKTDEGLDLVPVYRLYTPDLPVGGHFYTYDTYERSVLLSGGSWQDEGVAWYALRAGSPGPAVAQAEVKIEQLNLKEGTFAAVLNGATAPGGVSSVRFAIWSEADQSNLCVYPAAYWDGAWFAQADYRSHQGIHGTYQVQALVTGGDGVEEAVATATVEDPFRDVVYVPDSSTLAKARAYVESITTKDMTREEKLRVCFDSFHGHQEKNPWIPHYREADWYTRYADHYFDNMWGNCFSFAAAFGYMAKALGYEEVYACSSGGHGWIEIDGLCYDPEWALHHFDLSYYAMPYEISHKQNYLSVLNSGLRNNRLKLIP